MTLYRSRVMAILVWSISPALVWGALPAKPTAKSDAAIARDVELLAARIDQLVEAGWMAKRVKPAPAADDAEFVRRIYLDLAGRIPRVRDVHDFLNDKLPNKRQQLVEKSEAFRSKFPQKIGDAGAVPAWTVEIRNETKLDRIVAEDEDYRNCSAGCLRRPNSRCGVPDRHDH